MVTVNITAPNGNKYMFTKDDKGTCYKYSDRQGKTWRKREVIDQAQFNEAVQYNKKDKKVAA